MLNGLSFITFFIPSSFGCRGYSSISISAAPILKEKKKEKDEQKKPMKKQSPAVCELFCFYFDFSIYDDLLHKRILKLCGVNLFVNNT